MNPSTPRQRHSVRSRVCGPATTRCVSFFGACFALLLAGPLARAADVNLTLRESWNAVFGGRAMALHAMVSAPAPTAGQLSWELRTDTRSLARGERAVQAIPAGALVAIENLALPPVKPSVAISATLSVQFTPAGQPAATAQLTRTLWIFGDNPFLDRAEWLKTRQLRLYAPEGSPVPELLKKAEIPFEPVANASDVSDLKSGVVLVAPGVPGGEAGRLTEALMAAAARGLTVLWFRPPAALLARLPQPGGELLVPARIEFRGGDFVTDLDKRLDPDLWPPDGKPAATRLGIASDDGRVMLKADAEAGWPWLVLRYPGGGALVLTGAEVWEKWDAGPVPRWLFLALLEKIPPAVKP